jgi:hypothetical protein
MRYECSIFLKQSDLSILDAKSVGCSRRTAAISGRKAERILIPETD